MFEPRKLIPFSIAYCKAPIAVMTEITENTPIVIPSIVKLDRSLFTPSEPSAILIISLNNIVKIRISNVEIRDKFKIQTSFSRLADDRTENFHQFGGFTR